MIRTALRDVVDPEAAGSCVLCGVRLDRLFDAAAREEHRGLALTEVSVDGLVLGHACPGCEEAFWEGRAAPLVAREIARVRTWYERRMAVLSRLAMSRSRP